jgi:putative protease
LSLYLYRWRDDLYGVLRLADRVYAPFTALVDGQAKPERASGEFMAWLPAVTNGKLDDLIKKDAPVLKSMGLDGVLIGNAGHIELLRDYGLPLYGDSPLNAFSGWALKTYAGLGLKGIALSHELKMKQIAALPGCGIEKEAAVYGRLPLMVSAHCPVGAQAAGSGGARPCGLCSQGGAYELVDRTGARFPVLCDQLDCRCSILNADKLFVPSLAARLTAAGISTLRLYIYDESPQEVERLLLLFRRALTGEAPGGPLGRGFTKGHYFRGV